MKLIGILPNREKDIDLKVTRKLIESLKVNNCDFILPKKDAAKLDIIKYGKTEKEIYKESDIIICLGGDGTFLNAVKKVCNYEKPVLGINLGSLGFLTEVDVNEIDNAVIKLLNDKYYLEERIMLCAYVIRQGKEIFKDIAVNDFVVSRSELSRILHLKVFINNELFDESPGDGLIIATPTGSTAYSLSAGGPIVEPNTDVIILTPVCSHTLNSRPLITSSKTQIKIMIEENYTHNAMLTIDGQEGFKLLGGDEIGICTAKQKVRLIKLSDRSFVSVLRNKIYNKGAIKLL